MKNRFLILLVLCTMSLSSVCQYKREVVNVAIFVHEGVELFDFAGPGEVFVAAGFQSQVLDFNVFTVAATDEEVVSQTFLKVVPNFTLDNCPKPDVIVLPGGATGIPLRDPKVIDWIKRAHQDADLTLSVCTGAFLLGKAGLLEGIKATTHWGSIDALRRNYPNTEVLEDTKYIDNGKIVTSGGVSSGTEGSLHVVSRLAGEATAQRVARYMEYSNWDDRVGLVEKESPFISTVRSTSLDAALKQYPEGSYYGELVNLGNSFLKENEVARAEEIFQYLVEQHPVGETYALLGQVLKVRDLFTPPTQRELVKMISDGEMTAAMDLYLETKERHPQWILFSERSFHHQGEMLVHQDKLQEALTVFEINAKEFPASSRAWQSLAKCHEKVGNTKEARRHYKKSLDLDPDNDGAREALAELE